jgi:uncharacterized protein with HEPN domain
MRDERVYLNHMIDAIRAVERDIDGVTEAEFRSNEMLQDAVIRQIQILGEACKRLSADLKGAHADVPWRDIAGMRDKLVHDYFGVDVETVWLTARDDLPELVTRLEAINGTV